MALKIQLTVVLSVVLTLAGVMLFAPASGQAPELPDQRQMLASAEDVAAGSVCTIHFINNVSVYPDNVLEIVKGRLGEHDSDVAYFPIERSDGEDLQVEFTATGGDLTATVYYSAHTSLNPTVFDCTPPPPPSPPPSLPPEMPRTGLTETSSLLINIGLVLAAMGCLLWAWAMFDWDDD